MRSRFWTLLWIFGILFPMAFLGKLWPAFGRFFDSFFAPDWMHILMHGLLYAVLAFLLAGWIKPVSVCSGLKLLAVILLVGVLHESLQLISAGIWPGWRPEAFDLTVDLVGASCGLLIDRLLAYRKDAHARS
jgi:hypothetical protein